MKHWEQEQAPSTHAFMAGPATEKFGASQQESANDTVFVFLQQAAAATAF